MKVIAFIGSGRKGLTLRGKLDESYRDYSYYNEMGWFKSDFFFPVKLNFLQRISGHLFDRMGSGR